MSASGDGRPVLYTKDEAAEILRLKVSWLERRAAERKIPFTKLSGRYMFTNAHLAEIVRIFEEGPDNGHAEIATHDPTHRRRRRTQQKPRSTKADVAPLVPRPKRGPSSRMTS